MHPVPGLAHNQQILHFLKVKPMFNKTNKDQVNQKGKIFLSAF